LCYCTIILLVTEVLPQQESVSVPLNNKCQISIARGQMFLNHMQ